jgi:hypothetical protein
MLLLLLLAAVHLQAGRAARERAFHLALQDMMDYLHTGEQRLGARA